MFIHTAEELDIHMYLFIAVGLQHAHYQLLDVLELVGGILQEITTVEGVEVYSHVRVKQAEMLHDYRQALCESVKTNVIYQWYQINLMTHLAHI